VTRNAILAQTRQNVLIGHQKQGGGMGRAPNRGKSISPQPGSIWRPPSPILAPHPPCVQRAQPQHDCNVHDSQSQPIICPRLNPLPILATNHVHSVHSPSAPATHGHSQSCPSLTPLPIVLTYLPCVQRAQAQHDHNAHHVQDVDPL